MAFSFMIFRQLFPEFRRSANYDKLHTYTMAPCSFFMNKSSTTDQGEESNQIVCSVLVRPSALILNSEMCKKVKKKALEYKISNFV